MKNYHSLVVVFTILFLHACSHPKRLTNQVHNGDLIFVSAGESALSNAIDRVTKRDSSTNFSHVVLIEKFRNKAWVLHAGSKNGSEIITLKSFANNNLHRNLEIFSLNSAYHKSIPNAIKQAHSMLGKPYNFSYVLNDTSYYCSDFVERAFRADSIFKLEPMTFMNPKTGAIDSVWIDYYQHFQMEVPQGKPGCNPNGLSKSDKLIPIGKLVVN